MGVLLVRGRLDAPWLRRRELGQRALLPLLLLAGGGWLGWLWQVRFTEGGVDVRRCQWDARSGHGLHVSLAFAQEEEVFACEPFWRRQWRQGRQSQWEPPGSLLWPGDNR